MDMNKTVKFMNCNLTFCVSMTKIWGRTTRRRQREL